MKMVEKFNVYNTLLYLITHHISEFQDLLYQKILYRTQCYTLMPISDAIHCLLSVAKVAKLKCVKIGFIM